MAAAKEVLPRHGRRRLATLCSCWHSFPDRKGAFFRKKKYNAKVLVDWYVKLARVAEGYAKDDRDRPDFLAELSRLNPEQLLVLK
jgi:hypothetical protein